MADPNGKPSPDDDEAQGAIVADDGTMVCWFGNTEQYYNTAGDEPDEPDRNLMVAAPDLLAACKDFADRLDYLQKLWGAEGFTTRSVEKLREAIAKAEGR